MKLFLLPDLGSRNLFNKIFLLRSLPNPVYKQEIELSKQEMELFLLFPHLGSKNFFYKKFPFYSGVQIQFYEQEMELSKYKIELILLFPNLGSINFFSCLAYAAQ